jgi:hypothetical protein
MVQVRAHHASNNMSILVFLRLLAWLIHLVLDSNYCGCTYL